MCFSLELTGLIKNHAKALGCDLVGVCSIEALKEWEEEGKRILPDARSVVVVGCRLSKAAIASVNIRVAQFDTHCVYDKLDRILNGLSVFLEDKGCLAVSLPFFLPIKMSKETQGLIGDISLRHAAVEAGLGEIGLNRLLLTKRFGPRIRLGAVLTTAPLDPDHRFTEKLCNNCGDCVKACPAGAITEDGDVDVKKCTRIILKYGLPGLVRFVPSLVGKSADEVWKATRDPFLWEIWQTMTYGTFYNCFECVKACPIAN
jgi:epoxyqueuosine reductase QueG